MNYAKARAAKKNLNYFFYVQAGAHHKIFVLGIGAVLSEK
jgi:hypothetical protein